MSNIIPRFILGTFRYISLPVLMACLAMPLHANAHEVMISKHWVAATAPGQEVGAAFMTLSSRKYMKLVKVESESAGSVEIHSMSMTNGVMKMRKLEALELVPGKPVELLPGGYHLMLFDLKERLKLLDKVTFTLYFKDADGREDVMKLTSTVLEKK